MGQTLSYFINCRVVLADFRDTQRTAPQLKFTCSKSTVETLEEDLKYAQSEQKKNTFEQVNISWVHTSQMITLDKSEGQPEPPQIFKMESFTTIAKWLLVVY